MKPTAVKFQVRRRSRFVRTTLLLALYLATARSTAGPIRQADGTNNRQDIYLNNPTPSANDSSAHKMKSVSDVLVSTTPEDDGPPIEGLDSKKNDTNKNDKVYDEYVSDSGEQVTKSETTTKKEIDYNIQSAAENPSSNETDSFSGPFISEEDKDNNIQQQNKLGNHKLSTDVEPQTDKATKNETSTIKTTKEEQESSFDNNLSPFDDNSSAYNTTRDVTAEVTATSKVNTTSIGKLDLEKNNTNDAKEYEEYVRDSGEQVTESETTTEKEIAYNIQSANENPSSNEADSFNGPFISEENNDNDIQQQNKFGNHNISDVQVTKSETTTKKEMTYYNQSISEIPSSQELPIFKGPFISKEDENIKQKNIPGENRLNLNIKLESDKATKNEIPTTNTTEDEQESSINKNPPPFVDDSSSQKTTSDINAAVSTTTSESYSTSAGKMDLDKKNNNDIEYEEYTVSDEGVTISTTTEEITYKIQSAGEIPSSYESNSLKGHLLASEEDEKQNYTLEYSGSHTNDQSKTADKATKNEISKTKTYKEEQESSFNNNPSPFVEDSSSYKTKSNINAAVSTTTFESYSTIVGKIDSEKKNNNDVEYEEFTVSDKEVTSSATTEEITYKIQSAAEIPSSYESNSLKGPLSSKEDEKQNDTLEHSGLPDKSTDKNAISNETSTVTVDYSHSMKNSSDSNQAIDFFPLKDNATDGIQRYLNGSFDWDKNDLTDASEPIKSIDSKEHEKKLQNSSNSNENKGSTNTTIYDEYENESKEHKRKLQSSLNSDKNKGSKNMDYDEYESESMKHEKQLQNSSNSNENQGSKNTTIYDEYVNESMEHKKELQNSFNSDENKGNKNMDYEEYKNESKEHKKESQNSLNSDKNMDTHDEFEIESKEHKKELQNSSNSDKNMDTHDRFDVESKEHKKKLQYSLIPDEYKGSKNMDTFNEYDFETAVHQKELENSFISDEFKGSSSMDTYNENDFESQVRQKELQNSFIPDEYKGSRNMDTYNENDFNPDDDSNAGKSEKYANNKMEAGDRFMDDENAFDTNHDSRPEAGNFLESLDSIGNKLKQIMNTNNGLYNNMSPPVDPIGVLRYNHMQSMNKREPNDNGNPYALYVERVKSDCLRTLTMIN